MEKLTMDAIISAGIKDEASSEISVHFKKTIMIRQYEPEVFEADTKIVLSKPVKGYERMLITAIAQAQLEYEAYIGLYYRQMITESEFLKRKEEIVQSVEALRIKFVSLTGREPAEYLNC